MAIIRPGPLAGAISGAIGGVVFVAGKGSPIVRHRPAPRFKSSLALDQSKSYMGRLVNRWHSLSDAQQAAWSTAAASLSTTNRLGFTKPRSGFTYFIFLNKTIHPVKTSIVTTPPRHSSPPTPTAVAVDFEVSGDYEVSATRPAGATFVIWQVYGWASTVDHTPGAIPRMVFLFEITLAADLLRSVRTPWEARFGALQVGQHFEVEVRGLVTAYPFMPKIRVQGIATA